jgi:hypothetical protein
MRAAFIRLLGNVQLHSQPSSHPFHIAFLLHLPHKLREELSNARGINDLTADETTKLLLDNSRLQQAVVAARSEVLHKDEMLRLLSAEIK